MNSVDDQELQMDDQEQQLDDQEQLDDKEQRDEEVQDSRGPSVMDDEQPAIPTDSPCKFDCILQLRRVHILLL